MRPSPGSFLFWALSVNVQFKEGDVNHCTTVTMTPSSYKQNQSPADRDKRREKNQDGQNLAKCHLILINTHRPPSHEKAHNSPNGGYQEPVYLVTWDNEYNVVTAVGLERILTSDSVEV